MKTLGNPLLLSNCGLCIRELKQENYTSSKICALSKSILIKRKMHVAFIIIILLNVTLQAITAPVSNQSKAIEASELLKELQKFESEINPLSVKVQKVLETKETDIMDKSNNKQPSNDKKIMNERALDSEEPENQTASRRSKNIDQMRVIEALEELLQAPMISSFVTNEEEKHMIQSGIIALSKAFAWSKFTMEDVINASKSQVDQDSRNFTNLKGSTRKPLTDDEKVLGLENMVKDKVEENNLSLNEMRYLVKGLAAAVGARNNLSKTSTMKLEKTIRNGVYELVEKNEEPGSEQLHRLDLMSYKELSEDSQKKKEQKQNDDDDDLASLMKNLEKIWKRMNESNVERSASKKQKYLLKTILANSLALVESMGKQNEELKYFNKDSLLKELQSRQRLLLLINQLKDSQKNTLTSHSVFRLMMTLQQKRKVTCHVTVVRHWTRRWDCQRKL
ncbi:uncharacterized protein LOC124450996 isoform X2 [Xenia sp. Carnegie-2017]|uniref:uncharacterized protein LOC124450996 isoform X2 n=1 Tax=Xenia sp. Carnegie-2017 TaxID=2897299 RepID=UPI001F03C0F0|nr:uncharacterized protein LOC124450996 isoform X2 [Xenia sp. Carnegie-2017]